MSAPDPQNNQHPLLAEKISLRTSDAGSTVVSRA
jgi:hypothetical protein